MKNILKNSKYAVLSLFALLNCSGPSNERLVDNLAFIAKFYSHDKTILQIVIYTDDGRPSLLIEDYDRAEILSATPGNDSYHSMNASLSSDGWHITKIEKVPPLYGINFTGIGSPVLDFTDFLSIISENNYSISSSSPFITLYTPLVFPAVDTALYQTLISVSGFDSVFSVNSVSGR